jgi:hypothetical protein
VRSVISRTVLSLAVLAPCGALALALAGCNSADNPKIPDVPPSTAKPDTEVPKAAPGAATYGASKKYQDLMNTPK